MARKLRLQMVGMLVLALAARAEIALDVQPSRPRIYLGETILVNVLVNGADAGLAAPDLSALAADVRLLGSQSNSRHNFSYINGRVSRESFEGRVFAFEVKPRAAGAFTTGPVRLVHEGRTYTATGASVAVAGIEPQETVVARVTASNETVLVDEPFRITLAVAIAGLAPPNDRFEPLVPATPPRLECECLGQAGIPGLKTPDLQKTLQGLVQSDRRAPGFYINDYMARSPDLLSDPFNFDFDPLRPQPIKFSLANQRVTRHGREFREYTLALDFMPSREGDYTFGPVTFKGPVITGVTPDGRPLTREIFTVGPAVTVRVVPPPEEGRPEWFIGSVGRDLKVHAELDTAVCKVGDPLLLTLDVTGEVSLGNMRPPLLNLQPDLANDFRIYDDNVETLAQPGGKRFRYRIRPIREGTLELPPIKVAWFDTASRRYRTVTTAPIPVQARPTTQIVSDGGTNRTVRTQSLTVVSSIPAAITVTPTGARADRLLPAAGTLALFAAGPPAACALFWGVGRLWRRRDALVTSHRRRRALARARGELDRARSGSAVAGAPAVAAAVRSYLAARLQVAGNALTGPDAERLLRERRVPAAPATACGDLLRATDRLAYMPDGAGAGGADDLTARARQVVTDLDQALARPAATEDEP